MGQVQSIHDLRTYFIAVATNGYAAMHYNVRKVGSGLLGQNLNPAGKNP